MFYSFNANQFVIHGIHAARIMDIEGCLADSQIAYISRYNYGDIFL